MSKRVVLCYDAVEDMMTGPGETIMIDKETGMGADTAIEVAHIKTVGGMTGGTSSFGTDEEKRMGAIFTH